MTFFELLENEKVVWAKDGKTAEVKLLSKNSKNAGYSALFFCLVGAEYDGHDFAGEAYASGCRHFVAERALPLPEDASVLLCDNARKKLAQLSSRYYGYPEKGLTLIAVTGTKGKTTTACMIRDLLEAVGKKAAYIGSLGVLYSGKQLNTENTTPDSPELYWYLRQIKDAGYRYLVIEVSSQALATGRVFGLSFAVAVFTNLSRDHIGKGEHRTQKEYREAKLSLFSAPSPPVLVLNAGEKFTDTILKHQDAKQVLFYGNARKSAIKAGKIRQYRKENHFYTDFCLRYGELVRRVRLSLAGVHYVEDFLAALLTVLHITGESLDAFLPYSDRLSVTGRSDIITVKGGAVFVIDYAHNGASLKAALIGLRPYTEGRLFCLFGAVGGRVPCRRRDMALAASRYADFSIITEDNPGSENPENIIKEIYEIFPKKENVRCITDRTEAIRYLLGIVKKGDVVLLAGKGDECFQLRKEGKIPFSEFEVLRRFSPPVEEE